MAKFLEYPTVRELVKADAAADAVKMVGDGQLPNKYFVSINTGYYILGPEGLDWIDDHLPLMKDKQQSKTLEAFDSYAEAKELAESFALGDKAEGITVNSITIEDRISGEVYHKTKVFDPETCSVHDDENEDIQFTQEKLGADFR